MGLRESFRIDEKAPRASTELPLRARSAITEFQEETSVLSTYLLNHAVRFEFELGLGLGLVEAEYWRLMMRDNLIPANSNWFNDYKC